MSDQPVTQQEKAFCEYCKRPTMHNVQFSVEETKYLHCSNCRSTKKAA